jgi:hypothetical protein
MSSKFSLTQSRRSVSLVLTGNNEIVRESSDSNERRGNRRDFQHRGAGAFRETLAANRRARREAMAHPIIFHLGSQSADSGKVLALLRLNSSGSQHPLTIRHALERLYESFAIFIAHEFGLSRPVEIEDFVSHLSHLQADVIDDAVNFAE